MSVNMNLRRRCEATEKPEVSAQIPKFHHRSCPSSIILSLGRSYREACLGKLVHHHHSCSLELQRLGRILQAPSSTKISFCTGGRDARRIPHLSHLGPEGDFSGFRLLSTKEPRMHASTMRQILIRVPC